MIRRDLVFETTLSHEKVAKAWGREEIILNSESGNYGLKRLVLDPGWRCSVHHHEKKHETFIVEQGRLHVQYRKVGASGWKRITLYPGQRLAIPPGTQHSFWSHVPTSFMEVSNLDTPEDSIREDQSCKTTEELMGRWPAWPGNSKILVVGDTMVDHYAGCALRSRSMEEPILIASHEADEYVLGGSANVAAELARAGAKIEYVSVVGDDWMGTVARDLFEGLGDNVDLDLCISKSDTYPTTVKRRVMSEGRQIFREDLEEQVPTEDAAELVYAVEAKLSAREYDAVVIPNYRKGAITNEMFEAIGRRVDPERTLVFIDPFVPSDLLGEKAFLVKGNRNEIDRFIGPGAYDDDEERLKAFISKTKAKNVVMTGAADGAWIYNGYLLGQAKPKITGEVVDVTGAGDVMLSSMVLGALGKRVFGLEPRSREDDSIIEEINEPDQNPVEANIRWAMSDVLQLAVDDASLAVKRRRHEARF